MQPISAKTWAFIKASTEWYEYLEANGNDASEGYQTLVAARDAAAGEYEAELAAFVDARIGAA